MGTTSLSKKRVDYALQVSRHVTEGFFETAQDGNIALGRKIWDK